MQQATPDLNKAKALLKFGTQACWGARWQEAESAFRQAVDIAKAAKDERLHARSLMALMMALGYQGRAPELAQEIAAAGQASVEHGKDAVTALIIQGCFIRFMDPASPDCATMTQGLIRSALNHPKDVDVARALGQAAIVLNSRGEQKQAMTLFERALPVLEAGLGAAHPEYALMLQNLADVAFSLDSHKDFAKYEPAYRKTMAIQDKALAPNHPERAAPMMTTGLFCVRAGRYDEGQALLQRALSIALEVEGPEGGTVQMVRGALGELDERLADAKAEPYLLQRIEVADPIEAAKRRMALCRHYFRRGKSKSADPHYQKVLETLEKLDETGQMMLHAEMNPTAKVYILLSQDKPLEAEKLLVGELETLQRVLAEGHESTLQHMYFTGNAYRMMGKHKESLKLFERYTELARKVGQDILLEGLTRLLDAQLIAGDRKNAEKTAVEIHGITGRKPTMDAALNEFERQLRNVWHVLKLDKYPDLIGAALKNDGGACLVVGLCYLAGQGTPPNPDKARTWFETAGKAGNEDAVRLSEMMRTAGALKADFNDIASAAQAWLATRE